MTWTESGTQNRLNPACNTDEKQITWDRAIHAHTEDMANINSNRWSCDRRFSPVCLWTVYKLAHMHMYTYIIMPPFLKGLIGGWYCHCSHIRCIYLRVYIHSLACCTEILQRLEEFQKALVDHLSILAAHQSHATHLTFPERAAQVQCWTIQPYWRAQ